ncbi:S8 family peptidase [Prevotella intermedia]|uniref:Putative subtilisin n=1 Tax=Prevotella intermedia TaxID=28131 RepID=A0A0T7APF2_PREIN|nr:S8 family peptidase [Prevotella intermedia]AWX07943.1 bacteriocin [Prevotella intermedia]BAU18961.1 putative subtilisin [Prevotella intermedia]
MSSQRNKIFLVTYADYEVSRASAVELLGVTKARMKEGVSFMSGNRVALEDNILHFESIGVSVLALTSEDAKQLATRKGILAVEEDVKMHAFDIKPEGTDAAYKPEAYINQEEMEKFEGTLKALEGARVKSNLCQKGASIETAEPLETQDEDTIVGNKEVPEAEFLPFNHESFWGKSNLIADSPLDDERQVPSQEGGFADGYKKAMMDIFSTMLDANVKKDTSKSFDSSAASADALDSVKALSPSYIPWNIKMVKAHRAWARGYDGYRVKVAVLDTGIDYDHKDLCVYGGVDFSGSESYMDYNGHGTHCAGIIAAREHRKRIVGVAPRAKLYAVKVLDDKGYGNTSDIIAGMEWCVNNGIQVASMSLGGAHAPSVAYRNAISRCQLNGVLVVAAAGNSANSDFSWVCAPANSAQAKTWSTSPIAVGAVDRRKQIAYFSSGGQKCLPWNPVGCVAPGVNVKSTYLDNENVEMSGTSMACSHVAGLAALLCQRWNSHDVYKIKKQLLLGTFHSHAYPPSTYMGFGLINCDRVVSIYYVNMFFDRLEEWHLFS